MYIYSSNVSSMIDDFTVHLPASSQHHKYLYSQISFSPIGPESTMTEATAMALEFANELYAHEKIPVFTYGEASTTKLFLKDIRRELGYFLKVCDVNIGTLIFRILNKQQMSAAQLLTKMMLWDGSGSIRQILSDLGPILLSFYKTQHFWYWNTVFSSFLTICLLITSFITGRRYD
jgi:hypothetical protein